MVVSDYGVHEDIYSRSIGAMIFGWGEKGYGCYVH
jgi:hypothetical protein